MNIISIPELVKLGCVASFELKRASISLNGKVVCYGVLDEKSSLFILKSHIPVKCIESVVAVSRACDEQLCILHNQLGHLNRTDIMNMVHDNMASGLPTIAGYPDKFECPHCWAGKST
jgi:hypothetical protein